MNTRYIVIVIAIVAIAIGSAAFLMRHTDSGYQPPAAQQPGHGVVGKAALDTDPFDVTITFTDDGFSPADITIKQGTRVRFINASKEAFWPAIGVHPTHTLYPEKEKTDCLGSSFDACQDVQPGEFFDFTFNYLGTWRYHDHLHAYQTGTITVTAASSSAR